jgi:hypothetical protein
MTRAAPSAELEALVADVSGSSRERWCELARDEIAERLHRDGVVAVHGLGVTDAQELVDVVRALGHEPVDPLEPFTPRPVLAPGAYGSAAWPAESPMCMHHELGYALRPPSLVAVACLTAPRTGGATAVADGAAVLADLPPDIVEPAIRTGWSLCRTYSGPVGLTWQDAFGADSPDTVEQYARENDLQLEWLDSVLVTRRTRPAVLEPTGAPGPVWCNQLAFLSEWTMDPVVRDYLIMELGQDALPFRTSYGDGTPFGPAAVERVNAVYDRHRRWRPWQPGDVLLVDNLRTAHNREPYTGDRQMVVVHADPVELPAP